jgi:hypothetical protein
MFQPKSRDEWRPNPVLVAIPGDHPELQIILAGIGSPVVPMNRIIGNPHGRTVVYTHVQPYDEENPEATGLLRSWVSMGRRNAFALDFAKYLLALKMIGEKKNQKRQKRHVRPDPAATKPSALSAAASDLEGLSPTS